MNMNLEEILKLTNEVIKSVKTASAKEIIDMQVKAGESDFNESERCVYNQALRNAAASITQEK